MQQKEMFLRLFFTILKSKRMKEMAYALRLKRLCGRTLEGVLWALLASCSAGEDKEVAANLPTANYIINGTVVSEKDATLSPTCKSSFLMPPPILRPIRFLPPATGGLNGKARLLRLVKTLCSLLPLQI